MQVTKIFKYETLQNELLTEQITRSLGDSIDPRPISIFHGCHDTSSLGESPSGRMMYSQISMPRAKKETEPFDIEIYKDKEMTKKIVEMSVGVRIPAENINPGPLSGMTYVPADDQVQRETSHTITFTTSHKLEISSMVEIIMPADLTLPPLDTEFTVYRISADAGRVPLTAKVVKGG